MEHNRNLIADACSDYRRELDSEFHKGIGIIETHKTEVLKELSDIMTTQTTIQAQRLENELQRCMDNRGLITWQDMQHAMVKVNEEMVSQLTQVQGMHANCNKVQQELRQDMQDLRVQMQGPALGEQDMRAALSTVRQYQESLVTANNQNFTMLGNQATKQNQTMVHMQSQIAFLQSAVQ